VCCCVPSPPPEAVLAPIYKAATPLQDTIGSVDYVALQRSGDYDEPRNNAEYMKSGFVNAIPDALIDVIADNFEGFVERKTVLLFQHAGGAVARVPGDATAFAQRKALANLLFFTEWPLAEKPAEHVAYMRRQWAHFEPFTDGWYANEVADESASTINANYQGNYPRLLQVKKRYDPTNLFRLNANVDPAV
jgi:hypothetical protein